jgi:hypothetical protein
VSWRRRLCARFGDAEVVADGGDPVGVAQAGAGLPAVVELLLLVGERELLALLAMGLDAADLLDVGGVVEQQHDQAANRLGEAFHVLAAGEAVARLGGEVAALAIVKEHLGLVGVGAIADAGHELTACAQHLGQSVDPLGADFGAWVGRQLDVLERDPLHPGRELVAGDGADIEQQWRRVNGEGGLGHACPFR